MSMIDTDLWQKTRYTSPISFIIGKPIIEVDITQANISVLYQKDMIDDSLYESLSSINKLDRVIYVGNMQKRDPRVAEVLKSGIADIRKIILDLFSVDEYSLLSIRNDAVIMVDKYDGIPLLEDRYIGFIDPFNKLYKTIDAEYQLVIDPRRPRSYYLYNPYHPKMDKEGYPVINFRVKNMYTSYYKIGNKELLYYNDRINRDREVLDVAGINDETLLYHKEYFSDLLCTLFQSAEEAGANDTLTLLSNIYHKYINKEFPIGYYRRYDASSLYDFDYNFSSVFNYQALSVLEEHKQFLDISYNANILRQLQKIYSTIYFMQA